MDPLIRFGKRTNIMGENRLNRNLRAEVSALLYFYTNFNVRVIAFHNAVFESFSQAFLIFIKATLVFFENNFFCSIFYRLGRVFFLSFAKNVIIRKDKYAQNMLHFFGGGGESLRLSSRVGNSAQSKHAFDVNFYRPWPLNKIISCGSQIQSVACTIT